MRRSKLTADEIFEAEKASDDRKQTRVSGRALAKERDRNWALLTPLEGTVQRVVMEWGEGDQFKLSIRPYGSGKDIEVIFSAEEFRKWLRWV